MSQSTAPAVGSQPSPDGAGAPLRRQRGVRLTDLDRDRLWVIGHNGRRWETVGPLDELQAEDGSELRPLAGAGGEAPSTATDAAAPPS